MTFPSTNYATETKVVQEDEEKSNIDHEMQIEEDDAYDSSKSRSKENKLHSDGDGMRSKCSLNDSKDLDDVM